MPLYGYDAVTSLFSKGRTTMNTGNQQSGLSNTLAAVYATQTDARNAIKDLHKAGFKQTWLGLTKPADSQSGETMVEDTGGLGRFLSLSDRMPLHKALLSHGISEPQAADIEGEIAPGCAIITVYCEDNPMRAQALMTEHKGKVVGGSLDLPEAVRIASLDPKTGVDKHDEKEKEKEKKHDEHEERALHAEHVKADRELHPYDEDYADYPSDTFIERGTFTGGPIR